MNALAVIIDIVLIIISIVLIVAVLMQQGQRQGLGAIGGGAETFFGKNKAKTYESRMATITKIGAAAFIVLAIVATIITAHPAESSTSDDDLILEEIYDGDVDDDGIDDVIPEVVEPVDDGTDEDATDDDAAADATVEPESNSDTQD